jgi:Iap family predicted aminopeptidase
VVKACIWELWRESTYSGLGSPGYLKSYIRVSPIKPQQNDPSVGTACIKHYTLPQVCWHTLVVKACIWELWRESTYSALGSPGYVKSYIRVSPTTPQQNVPSVGTACIKHYTLPQVCWHTLVVKACMWESWSESTYSALGSPGYLKSYIRVSPITPQQNDPSVGTACIKHYTLP